MTTNKLINEANSSISLTNNNNEFDLTKSYLSSEQEIEEYDIQEKKQNEEMIFGYLSEIKLGINNNELEKEHLIKLRFIIKSNNLHLKFPGLQCIIEEVLHCIESKLILYNNK